MTTTANLGLPCIEGSQAQKHVTHNEALRILDAVVQIGVLDADRTAPPTAPAEGDRHIVAAGPTGAWAGHADAVAAYEDGAWRFLVPKPGWCAWCDADGALLVYDGTAWTDVAGGAGAMSGSVAQLGINDTASSPNLLTVKSNAALFGAVTVAGGGTGDMRLQISKESSAKTASVVFSDAFSGRAEFGLIGSDAFRLKVSSDGSAFVEALAIDQSSGNAAFSRGMLLTGVISPSQISSNQNDYSPTGFSSASVVNLSSDASRSVSGLAGGAEGRVVVILNTGSQIITLLNESASSSAANRFALGSDVVIGARRAALLRYDGTASRWYAIARPAPVVRELLTAARTYYVRSDGSNSNDGLANTSGGAFLTVQKAIDTVYNKLDLGGFNVTIQLGAGTFAGFQVSSPQIGAGTIKVKGDTTTPANVVISGGGANAIYCSNYAVVSVEGLKITTTAGVGISADLGAQCNITGKMEFGACDVAHMMALQGGSIIGFVAYSITGGAYYHLHASIGGSIRYQAATVTITGTPAFAGGFAHADTLSLIYGNANTYSGATTGPRYAIEGNSVIFTSGAQATPSTAYFPGNVNGTTATGGQIL